MWVRKVSVKNFRGLKDTVVELGDRTVIIGENNSGKTSFLDALRFALTRAGGRRGLSFEDYDYHLGEENSQPGDAGDLSITIEFEEPEGGVPGELQGALNEAIVTDAATGKAKIILQVTSKRAEGTDVFTTEIAFLDASYQRLGPKSQKTVFLPLLQRFVPFFYLAALRDASKEFGPRSSFWGPFLQPSAVDPVLQREIEGAMAELNGQIIAANGQLTDVVDSLTKAKDIVNLGMGSKVGVEALPLKVWDMLTRAKVSVSTATGAKMPLESHGAGTQSLSVILLFEAFVRNNLKKSFHQDSTPILALEEPETHLHPNAVRALWTLLGTLSSQTIIASHSGDLLSEVPLESIRRFKRVNGNIEVKQIRSGNLTLLTCGEFSFTSVVDGESFFSRSAGCWEKANPSFGISQDSLKPRASIFMRMAFASSAMLTQDCPQS